MKKKIVFFTEALYGGGVQRILQIILSHFDYTRYDVTLYTVRKNVIRQEYFPEEIKYKYIFDVENYKDSVFRRIWYKIKNKTKLFVYYHFNPGLFYQLFIREKSDVAIAFIEGYATRLISGFPKEIKKIAWLHIELETFHWSDVAYQNRDEERKSYLSMQHIPCVSKEVKRQLDNLYGVNNKSTVLYNPIDTELIKKQACYKDPLILPKGIDSIRIISIGSLDERKGHIRLLSVCNSLIKEGHSIEIWILGQGEKLKELEDYVSMNNIKDKVTFWGFQENPFCFLNASDIYVCSSYAEGYNTAITEALVLGKPVISTECSGVKEQLGVNNEWGICVPNSEEGLYNGLKKMLDPEIRKHYSSQAAIRGKDFTLEKSMNEIYKLIDL